MTGTRIGAPLLGLLAAVLMHGLWNGSAFWGFRGFFLTYLVVMLPLLVLVLAVGIWARSREGRMLDAALQQTVQMGWTRPEEVRWVAHLSDRLAARAYAPDRLTREPARLIGELKRSSRATHLALQEASEQGRPVGDLPRAAAEIDRAAASLENMLRTADREPNRQLKEELTTDLAAQAKALDELSAELRRSLLKTSRSIDTRQLDQATTRLRGEISAMGTWRDTYGNRPDW